MQEDVRIEERTTVFTIMGIALAILLASVVTWLWIGSMVFLVIAFSSLVGYIVGAMMAYVGRALFVEHRRSWFAVFTLVALVLASVIVYVIFVSSREDAISFGGTVSMLCGYASGLICGLIISVACFRYARPKSSAKCEKKVVG